MFQNLAKIWSKYRKRRFWLAFGVCSSQILVKIYYLLTYLLTYLLDTSDNICNGVDCNQGKSKVVDSGHVTLLFLLFVLAPINWKRCESVIQDQLFLTPNLGITSASWVFISWVGANANLAFLSVLSLLVSKICSIRVLQVSFKIKF